MFRTIQRVDAALLHYAAVDTIVAIRDSTVGTLPDHLARLRRSGSPHDAVARYLERVVADRQAPEMPGGLAPDVVWYLRLVVGFAFPGTPEEFPVEYLFSVSTDARTLQQVPNVL